jgi:hypothetical protein
VRAGDWGRARDLFLQYVNAGGQPNRGLANRRAEEATWLDPAAATAGAQSPPTANQLMAGGLIGGGPPRSQTDSLTGGSMPARPGPPPSGEQLLAGIRALGATAPFGAPGGGIGSDYATSPPQIPMAAGKLGNPWNTTVTQAPDADAIVRGATAAQAANNPAPAQPSFGDRLGSWINSPAFLMGLSILGTPPGGAWGPNAAQAGLLAQKSRREQTEYERQQQRRAVMDKVWAAAFPQGQPNMQHPLLAGLSPEMAQQVYAAGPEAGLPELWKYAFFRGQQQELLRMQMQKAGLIAGLIPGMGGGTQDAGTLPATGAPAGPPAAPGAAPPTIAGAGAAPAAAAPAPALAAAPAARPALSPMERGAVAADLLGNRLESVEQIAAAQRAPQRAGETTYAQAQATQLAHLPQARSQLTSVMGDLDAMGRLARQIREDKNLGWAVGGHFPLYGTGSMLMRHTPGTVSYDIASRIESLKSAAGLTSLQAMRQASPTGGALGQVSDRENAILQDSLARLDPKMSPQAFREQLQRIEAYVQRTQKRLQAAFQEQYGAGQGPSSSPTANDPLGIR